MADGTDYVFCDQPATREIQFLEDWIGLVCNEHSEMFQS